jgi:hypothetical protein
MAGLAAAVVFTAAANFHHMRFVRFLAVLPAVFAVLFSGTIARAVFAFLRDFVSHDSIPG